MAIDRLAYKLVMDHKQFVDGAVASRKELNFAKRVMFETQAPAQKYQKQIDSLGGLLRKGAIDQQTFNAAVRQLRSSTTHANGGLRRMNATMVGMLSTIGGVTVGIAGIGLAARSAARNYSDFAKSMAKSTSIMGDLSEETLKKMEATAIDVSFKVEASASDAAEAYFFLASAALSAEQAIASMPVVADFAQAGTFNLALATDLLTDAQKSMGLASEDTATHLKNLTHVSDVFTAANIKANASIQQFSEAITAGAGPTAKRFGVTLEETLAVLQVFANTGFAKGSDAGTQFSIVMRELTNKFVLNKKVWLEAGIDVFDEMTGEFKGVVNAIGDMEKAMSGMTKEEGVEFLMSLGLQAKSIAGLQTLLGESKDMDAFIGKISDIDGITKQVARDTMPEMTRAVNAMKAGWDELSTIVIPAFADGFMAADGRPLEEQIREFNASIKDLIPLIEDIGKKFGILAKNVGFVADKLSFIANFAGFIREKLKLPENAEIPGFIPDLEKGELAIESLVAGWKEWADRVDGTIGERIKPGTAGELIQELLFGKKKPELEFDKDVIPQVEEVIPKPPVEQPAKAMENGVNELLAQGEKLLADLGLEKEENKKDKGVAPDDLGIGKLGAGADGFKDFRPLSDDDLLEPTDNAFLNMAHDIIPNAEEENVSRQLPRDPIEQPVDMMEGDSDLKQLLDDLGLEMGGDNKFVPIEVPVEFRGTDGSDLGKMIDKLGLDTDEISDFTPLAGTGRGSLLDDDLLDPIDLKPSEKIKRETQPQFAAASLQGSQRDIAIRAAASRTPGAGKEAAEKSVDLLGEAIIVLKEISSKTEGVVVSELTDLPT